MQPVYLCGVCHWQVSDGSAEDKTSRASLVLSTKVDRVKGGLEKRDLTADLLASGALRSQPRTSLREVASSLQTSEYL